MRFYTRAECESWFIRAKTAETGFDVELARRAHSVSARTLSSIFHRSLDCQRRGIPSTSLLFITEWSIWPRSENWHLYYRLRQTYADYRLLEDAPGHLFLEHESEDIASFLQLSMLNGWGGYVLAEANDVNAFFSHDEFIDFFAENSENLADVRKDLGSKACG